MVQEPLRGYCPVNVLSMSVGILFSRLFLDQISSWKSGSTRTSFQFLVLLWVLKELSLFTFCSQCCPRHSSYFSQSLRHVEMAMNGIRNHYWKNCTESGDHIYGLSSAISGNPRVSLTTAQLKNVYKQIYIYAQLHHGSIYIIYDDTYVCM
jgi:hypothetical protein